MLDIHVVSHTHWDREWYLTHEQFRFRLVALIDRLLDLLDADPSYRHFHLDGQTIVLEDYLEIRPEAEPRLRRAIASGRVLIGPWYVMPDEFLVSGESLVRNLLRGHRIARAFGTPMPVGYLPDLFGHVGQMPQIWRQCGLDNTILWRGFGGPRAEYWWDAPDGSRVLMMHLPPEGYCNATRIVFDPGKMLARAAEKVDFERGRTATGQALLMNGVDHVEPHTAIPALVEQLSAVEGQRAIHSTLPAYVAAVRAAVESRKPALETVAGELRSGADYANLLPGVLSARVYLKLENARVQTLLESYAEPLAVFASLAARDGGLAVEPDGPTVATDVGRGFSRAPAYRYPDGELRHAWKTLLQNHPHDSICGCSIDAVHEENMTRFARAGQVAGAVVDTALDAISDSVSPPAGTSTLRILAVNTDIGERAQVVEAVVDLPVDSAEPWRTMDPQALDRPVVFWPESATVLDMTAPGGVRVPFQILGEERLVGHLMSRYETPWALNIRRVRLLFWAPALPGCGYAAFDARIGPPPTPASAVEATTFPRVTADQRAAENEFVRLSVSDRGVFEVTDKATGITYRRVAALEDSGDVGDEYNYSPPKADRLVTDAEARVRTIARVADGPLRAAFRVEFDLPLPVRAASDRASRAEDIADVPVTLEASIEAASPRVTFNVTVENRASDHRLRLLFPTGVSRLSTARADTAFDVVTRPARVMVPEIVRNEAPVGSAPLISVVDAGGARSGAAVIARGLMEYEVVAAEDGDAIALTLVRAVGDLSRNDLATRPSGNAGPPIATPGAQCLGAHRFEVAFQPRAAPPEAGDLVQSARSHLIRPSVVTVRRRDGTGPASRSFVAAHRPRGTVVLSALKRAEDRPGLVLRVFNPADAAAEVTVGVDGLQAAHLVNLLEERQAPLAVEEGRVALRLKPHEIRTIELETMR